MRWSYIIAVVIAVSGIILIGANKIIEVPKSPELAAINASYFEKSPIKLKEIIDTHRLFHKKIKITFAGLIDALEPHMEEDDVKELKEAAEALLDKYKDEIDKAENALRANNIFLTNNILASVAKELKNIYAAQETLLELKHQMKPQPSKQKNNKIIKTASIPKETPWGCFFEISR